MHGRIDACGYAEEHMKHPVILPKDHPVTNLVIAEYHDKYRHLYHQTIINEIWKRYHIQQLQATYKKVLRNCQRCKNQQSVPHAPIMGNLPESRLAAFTRPFSGLTTSHASCSWKKVRKTLGRPPYLHDSASDPHRARTFTYNRFVHSCV